MKKFLFSFIALFISIIAYADTDSGVYEAFEDGELTARIELNRDGTATIQDLKYNETKYVTYNINGAIQPGQTWRIEFYDNGQTYRGTWYWATKDGKAIDFSGMFFKRAGFSKYHR